MLNKPAGLAVQGGTNTERHVDGLLDALRFDSDERPRLVHRLDKDTSGVLLIARSAGGGGVLHPRLSRQDDPQDLLGRRRRLAGAAPGPHRSGARQTRRGVGGERVRADDEEGKHAVTYYQVIDHAGDRASWLALLPVTGRTHQLRAHCAALGTPILGDGKYGGAAAHTRRAAPRRTGCICMPARWKSRSRPAGHCG